MPLTEYLTLGRSGLRVSPLCLGAMTFGMDWGWGTEVADAQRIIDAYLERGGNFIDTANIYTKGHSEKIIGDHLGRNSAKRDRVVIATKFMGGMFKGDPNSGGAGRKAIYDQLHHSLRRLQTEYIDLYWMHFNDRHTPIEETMRTLDDIVRAGKVRYVGFSDTPAWRVSQAQTTAVLKGWTPLVALQIEYSLVERTVEGDLIPMAMDQGLGVTPWSPLKGGVLTGKYTRQNAGTAQPGRGQWVTTSFNERTFGIIDVLMSVARQTGATPSQVAVAWVQSRPGVASTIIGARTMEQLSDNLGALSVHLTPEHLHALDEASRPVLPFPHDFLRFTDNTAQSGATINGDRSEYWPMGPQSDKERW